MTSAAVYVSDLAHVLGEQVPLEELPEVRAAGNADRLLRDGLRIVRASTAEPWELAAASAEQTLRSRPDGPPVDAVFYATDTFWPEGATVRAPARFLHRVGLARVPLVGVGLQGCGNTGALLAAAANAVTAGASSAALCVTTDRAPDGGRLMAANVSVLSDAAASFVVAASRPAAGFRLLGIGTATEAGMHELGASTDTLATVKATADGVARATTGALERAGLDRDAISCVVANNYGETSLKIFCAAARVPYSRLYRGTVAEVGHGFAADTVINLQALAAAGQLSAGDLVLALWSGFSTWSAALLEHVRG